MLPRRGLIAASTLAMAQRRPLSGVKKRLHSGSRTEDVLRDSRRRSAARPDSRCGRCDGSVRRALAGARQYLPGDRSRFCRPTAALLQYLGIDKPDVMKYSLGGEVALRIAIQHPAMVGKLVVVSVAFNRSGWHPEILADQVRRVASPDYDWSAEVTALTAPTWVDLQIEQETRRN